MSLIFVAQIAVTELILSEFTFETLLSQFWVEKNKFFEEAEVSSLIEPLSYGNNFFILVVVLIIYVYHQYLFSSIDQIRYSQISSLKTDSTEFVSRNKFHLCGKSFISKKKTRQARRPGIFKRPAWPVEGVGLACLSQARPKNRGLCLSQAGRSRQAGRQA
jgi:hypothetical protein